MAQTTANYNLNIAEGTDTVNLLTQCYPNFSTLDSIIKGIDDSAITVASETKSGTVHQLVRSNTNRNVIRFSATSNFTLGDTFTVDGTPVTATTIAGTALQTGDFVINSNVIAILNGALLTVLVGGSAPTPDAEDISYDNSVSGLTAADVQAAIDELAARPVVAAAEDVTYNNSVSGLTATDVQAAIDELKNLLPPTPQTMTGVLSNMTSSIVMNFRGQSYYWDGANSQVLVPGYATFKATGSNNWTLTSPYNGTCVVESVGTFSIVAGITSSIGNIPGDRNVSFTFA